MSFNLEFIGLEEENSFEDGSPGESVINPQLCIFKYTNIKAKDSNEPTFPLERRKKATQKSRPPMKVEEDLEEVIEIMSSPEKSPFKKHNDSVQMHLNRSKIRRQIIPLCDDQDSDSSNDDNKDVVIHVLSSDTDSLPSLYDPALQKEKDVDTDFEMEDEEDEEEEEELEFKKFQGQMHFDLYQAFTSINRGLTADEILNVLLSPHGFSICETVPQYVQTPSGFLLDTRKLKDAKDVRADGNGAWKAQTKPKRKYKINSKGKAHIARDALNSGSDNIYEIIRSYSTHKETSNFRRLIIEVNGSPFIILQYYFIGPTVPVLMKPHGNSKQKTAPVYRRVAPSSLQRMTNMANSSRYSTKSVIKNFIEEEGGIENIHAQDIPRNEQQIRNLKRKMKDDDTDEITEILHEFDVQRDNFIRKIDIRPDFIVVLASDQQLKDLNRFCTRHPCSILGIDPTFHFGEFDVTVTTYRNPMLQDITPGKKMLNTSPVFVGPVCVHKKKDTQTYFTFFSTLIAKEKELRNMKAIGTDGEVALANASLMAFESATQLRCFNHIQRNIKNKLQEIGVSKKNKKIVISDIFGSLADTALRYAGLVDCLTNIEFDQKLETLQEKWDTLSPNFYMWFKRHYADNFKSHVIQSVRNVAGLSRSECYTTNDNESMNSALQKVCGKNKTLPSFLKELKDFIKTQENQISLAIVQQGHLRLKEEFQNLEVPISTWATWDPSERKNTFQKLTIILQRQRKVVAVYILLWR